MKHIAIHTGPERVVVVSLCPRLQEEILKVIPVVDNKNISRFYARFEFAVLNGVTATASKLMYIFSGVQPFQSVVEVPDMDQFHARLKEAFPDNEKKLGFHPDGHVSCAPRVTLTIYKPDWMRGDILLSNGYCPARSEEHGNYIKGVPAREFLRLISQPN